MSFGPSPGWVVLWNYSSERKQGWHSIRDNTRWYPEYVVHLDGEWRKSRCNIRICGPWHCVGVGQQFLFCNGVLYAVPDLPDDPCGSNHAVVQYELPGRTTVHA